MNIHAGHIMGRLPPVPDLKKVLKGKTVREVADMYGVTSSAINVKLRRYGLPRGNPPHSLKHKPVVAPSMVPKTDRVVRTTISGAQVTMPRLIFLDGPAPDPV